MANQRIMISGTSESAESNTNKHSQYLYALWSLIAVIAVLFSILVVAYLERMQLPDWRSLADPALLWFNTGFLALASVAIQVTYLYSSRHSEKLTRQWLYFGGVFAAAFLVGQLFAWQQLSSLGYFLKSNPANSFFYLITGMHGLHLFGGIIAWGRIVRRLSLLADYSEISFSVKLCAIYWHFMLIVWLVLFGLMLST